MLVKQIELKHFRCFEYFKLSFDTPVVFIEGANGAGKTSVLEALHYLCYLRSFRSTTPKDLIKDGADGFFIKISMQEQESFGSVQHELSAGFSTKKRLVKFDNKTIKSFKELVTLFRVVSLVEDDLALIKGGPEYRRAFIDQTLYLIDPSILTTIRIFKKVLENRNALLRHHACASDVYEVWTKQLWDISYTIALKRAELLEQLGIYVDEIASQYLDEKISIELRYQRKGGAFQMSYDEFRTLNPELYSDELRIGRSLFGAHLDDFVVSYGNRKSRTFASRGQQKLIVVLLKVAQIKLLNSNMNLNTSNTIVSADQEANGNGRGPILFLLDDFMTDFDTSRLEFLFSTLKNLDLQMVFTFPQNQIAFKNELFAKGEECTILTM